MEPLPISKCTAKLRRPALSYDIVIGFLVGVIATSFLYVFVWLAATPGPPDPDEDG
jgi:hypothetical protein